MHFTSLYISNCRSYLCAIWPWRLDRPDCKSQGQFCNFGGRARRNCFAWWLLSHVSLWNLATACCMFPWDIDHMLLEKLLVLLPFLTPYWLLASPHDPQPFLSIILHLLIWSCWLSFVLRDSTSFQGNPETTTIMTNSCLESKIQIVYWFWLKDLHRRHRHLFWQQIIIYKVSPKGWH